MIDLLALEPHKISTDLSSYVTLIYGTPKSGKSTFMHRAFGQDALFVATEKGYLGLAGVMAIDAPNWKTFREVIKQLKKDEVKAKFKVVVIDTVDLLYDMAHKHVLMINGIDKLGDIPFGAGYKMVDDLFKDALLEIQGLGYGLAFISHSIATTNEDTGQTKFSPSLNKRGAGIINKMVDTIGFAYLRQGESGEERVLFLRETLAYTAGTRFAYMPASIPLDANVFKEEMARAIEKEGEINPDALTTDKAKTFSLGEVLDYDKLMTDLRVIANKFNENEQIAEMRFVIENHLGKGRLLSELVKGQEDIMSIILDELSEKAKELGIA